MKDSKLSVSPRIFPAAVPKYMSFVLRHWKILDMSVDTRRVLDTYLYTIADIADMELHLMKCSKTYPDSLCPMSSPPPLFCTSTLPLSPLLSSHAHILHSAETVPASSPP